MFCLCTIFAYCVRQWIELWNLNSYKIVLLKWADDDDKILLYAQLWLTHSSRHCVACLIISLLLLTYMRQSYWLIALFNQTLIILLLCINTLWNQNIGYWTISVRLFLWNFNIFSEFTLLQKDTFLNDVKTDGRLAKQCLACLLLIILPCALPYHM